MKRSPVMLCRWLQLNAATQPFDANSSQLGVLHVMVTPPKLTASDPLLCSWLSKVWAEGRFARVIVNSKTLPASQYNGIRRLV
jgi:hypothetical protein